MAKGEKFSTYKRVLFSYFGLAAPSCRKVNSNDTFYYVFSNSPVLAIRKNENQTKDLCSYFKRHKIQQNFRRYFRSFKPCLVRFVPGTSKIKTTASKFDEINSSSITNVTTNLFLKTPGK